MRMNSESLENQSTEGNDDMGFHLRDMEEDADKEEAELHEWNQKRKGYMEGTQAQLVAQHTGIFGNTIEFMEDGEHEEEIQDVIGKNDWERFWKLRDIYFTAKMTPSEWHESQERKNFYTIIEKVAQHPPFRKYVMRGLNQEEKILH
jgi:hypothetical protein